MIGIDVSNFQRGIDFEPLKRNGVRFVFAKATEGRDFVDASYNRHRDAARAAGLPFGAYHFARPDTNVSDADDALDEAAHFLAIASPRDGDLVPVLDLERAGIPGAKLERWVRAWLEHVEQAVGQAPLFYTFPAFWNEHLRGVNLSRYPLWLAAYGPNDGKRHAAAPIGAWTGVTVHQFTSNGRIGGWSGRLDVNFIPDAIDIGRLRLGEQPATKGDRFGPPYELVGAGRRVSRWNATGFARAVKQRANRTGKATVRATRRTV